MGRAKRSRPILRVVSPRSARNTTCTSGWPGFVRPCKNKAGSGSGRESGSSGPSSRDGRGIARGRCPRGRFKDEDIFVVRWRPNSRNTEIEDVVGCLRFQPFPCIRQVFAVHGIFRCVLGLITTNDDNCFRGAFRHSIEPTEPLPQRVQTGAFRDQGMEVKVGAAFKALRADDELRRCAFGIRQAAASSFSFEQSITVEWPHSPGEQHCVVAEFIFQARGPWPRG